MGDSITPLTDQERRALDRDVAVLLGHHLERIQADSVICQRCGREICFCGMVS